MAHISKYKNTKNHNYALAKNITFLIAPVLYKFITNSGKKPVGIFINPLFTSLTLLVTLFILIFTPVWSLGRAPFNRTVNIVYFVFLIGWFYNVMILVFYFFRKYNFNIGRIPQYFYILTLIGNYFLSVYNVPLDNSNSSLPARNFHQSANNYIRMNHSKV